MKAILIMAIMAGCGSQAEFRESISQATDDYIRAKEAAQVPPTVETYPTVATVAESPRPRTNVVVPTDTLNRGQTVATIVDKNVDENQVIVAPVEVDTTLWIDPSTGTRWFFNSIPMAMLPGDPYYPCRGNGRRDGTQEELSEAIGHGLLKAPANRSEDVLRAIWTKDTVDCPDATGTCLVALGLDLVPYLHSDNDRPITGAVCTDRPSL